MAHIRTFYGKRGRVALYSIKSKNKPYKYLVVVQSSKVPKKANFFDAEEALSNYKDNMKRVW